MYIDKLIKKQVITLVVSVLILLTIFIGVSLASFLSVDEGASNTISMGDLKISFCSDTSCNSTYTNYGKVIGTTTQDGTTVPVSIYPYATQSEALTNTPYIFNIENTGTLKAKLNIKLIEDADFLPTGDYASYTALTTLYANHLKIGIKQCSDTNVFEYGDINMDGLITNDDNTLINNHIAGTSLLTGKALELADVNQDGSVSSADATLVSNFISSGVYNVLTTSTYGELTNNSILSDESLDPGSDNTYCLWTWLDETTPNGVQSTYFVANLEFEAEYKPI